MNNDWSRRPATSVQVNTARRLRASLTPQEVKVWNWLRERMNAVGWRFRRQVRIGPYVADFANLRPKVVIEIDGDSHGTDDGLEKDLARDAFLKSEGFLVIRINNTDIGRSGDEFIDRIRFAIADACIPEPANE